MLRQLEGQVAFFWVNYAMGQRNEAKSVRRRRTEGARSAGLAAAARAPPAARDALAARVDKEQGNRRVTRVDFKGNLGRE